LAFRDGIACLAELPERVRELLDPGPPEAEAATVLQTPGARRLLAVVAEKLERGAEDTDRLDGATFKGILQSCGQELGLKGRDLFMPARAALSGRTHGPELPLLFDALGVERAQERLRRAAAG
jgi:glutamyl/glutaminyl-tRNA synthetase